MRPVLVALALLLAPAPLLAQEGGLPAAVEAARPDIEAVIAGQLDAFNARDVEGAWAFASPGIQALFGSAERFGAMVEVGYPMVWTNEGARFEELRAERGALRQRVIVRDAEGAAWALDYAVVPLADGWRIDGVEVLPAPDVGV